MSSPSAEGATMDLEQTFLASLPLIDRIISILSRRNGLSVVDAEDFASWAKLRMIEDEYAILRTFGGRSSLATYLSVVLHNLLCDYRNARWGRWRPSAAAVRAGPVAVRLEELLQRDGCTLREAVEVLRAAGTSLSDTEIARLRAKIPHRVHREEVQLSAASAADALQFRSRAHETADSTDNLDDTVRSVMSTLPPEDAIILRLRFWNGMSVADVARTLRMEQKPLYRRLEAIQARLRTELTVRGVDRSAVVELLNKEGEP